MERIVKRRRQRGEALDETQQLGARYVDEDDVACGVDAGGIEEDVACHAQPQDVGPQGRVERRTTAYLPVLV